MRLSKHIQREIAEALRQSFGDVSIILFGSRVDDTKRGGDIDLVVDSHFDRQEFQQRKARFLALLLRKDIEIAIDLVQWQDAGELLSGEILRDGIELSC